MSLADWIAIITPTTGAASAISYAASKLTRIAVAVERLEESMRGIGVQVADHENRLNRNGL